MPANKYDIGLTLEQITTRLDNHGAEIHAMNEKLDHKFEQLFSTISSLQKEDKEEHHELSERLTRIESEKGIVGRVLTIVLGATSGLIAGWFRGHS